MIKNILFSRLMRRGGKRVITSPETGLKYIQKKLNKFLLDIYPLKSCVHGFSKTRSIKSNANVHLYKKIIINIDLEDFFTSINFGRVRGIFKSDPFNFNDEIATALAQICCYNNALPQGAPTSPIITNYICRKLDNRLMKLATKQRCSYTRYADDITISTNVTPLPNEIGSIIDNKLIISNAIRLGIEENGFKINDSKIRYGMKNNRQEVTGLIVNNKKLNVNRKYVRNVRAMINAWEKYGLEKAAEEHFNKYNYTNRQPKDKKQTFVKKIVGKIGFIGWVRGKNDKIYHKLVKRVKALDPEIKLAIILKDEYNVDKPIIYCEGKTDVKHLKAAFQKLQNDGLYLDLDIVFFKDYEKANLNNAELLNICETFRKVGTHRDKIICIFDRDDRRIREKVSGDSHIYKEWGNNVYSFLLPRPAHRNFEEICIEHLYENNELMTADENGRRIFLSSEFDKNTKRHISEELIYKDKKDLSIPYPFVIDNRVLNNEKVNVALPKNDFAEYILENKAGYNNFTFENFKPIFEIIKEIIEKTE